jgi:hypothetical protein
MDLGGEARAVSGRFTSGDILGRLLLAVQRAGMVQV